MNEIKLDNVVPIPLKDRATEQSDIWGKQLTFTKGNFYLIKAVSGSGKSTFINSIYGLRNDYSGNICYDSQSIKDANSDDLSMFRKSQLSIVFQDLRLFEQLTAEENILLKGTEQKLSDSQKDWCNRLNVTALLNKICSQLSYGERQRVAIIRGLSQPFDFIFLDEPFSHLDEENGKKALLLITEIVKKNQAGIIMTSLGNERFIQAENTLRL